MTEKTSSSNRMSEVSGIWINHFPSLKRMSKTSVYKRLGPFLCGFKFDNIYGECYTPYFHFVSLWTSNRDYILQSDSSSVFSANGQKPFPLYSIPFTDKSTKPLVEKCMDIYDILYSVFLKKEVRYQDFTVQLDLISGFNRTLDISVAKYKFIRKLDFLSKVLGNPSRQFDRYSYRYAIRYAPYRLYCILRINLAIALFYDKPKLFEKAVETYKNDSRYWSSNFLRNHPIFQIETILREFDNREEFMTQINQNCEKPAIAKLYCGQLTFG